MAHIRAYTLNVLFVSSFKKVLDAFTVVGETEPRGRFWPIIQGLLIHGDMQLAVCDTVCSVLWVDGGRIFLFQHAALQLINAILNGTDDVEHRVHLRSELMRTGLVDIVDDVSPHGSFLARYKS